MISYLTEVHLTSTAVLHFRYSGLPVATMLFTVATAACLVSMATASSPFSSAGRHPSGRRLGRCAAGYADPTAPATSVHRLRPGDVHVVAALGDSVTTAWVARARLREDRGFSWSAGGERGALTLPNLLRRFSPHLEGAARGPGEAGSPAAGLNVAVNGARHAELPAQAERLIRLVRHHPRIDAERDWKVVTVMIGGNDICQSCSAGDSPSLTETDHLLALRETLDLLHSQLPRTFVNLVPLVDVAGLRLLQDERACRRLSWLLHSVGPRLTGRGVSGCPCLAGPDRVPPQLVQQLVRRYRRAELALVASGRYDTRDDFTVVVQPFTLGARLPREQDTGGTDTRFVAVDCFHPSLWGQELLAAMLWNNMVSPVDAKSADGRDAWHGLKCPDPDFPFLGTYKNRAHTAISYRDPFGMEREHNNARGFIGATTSELLRRVNE